MCGIFGGYNIDKGLKNNIINQLSHRGPDGSGFYASESENILMCHTRLSIIDTSEKGLQPFTDTTGNYVIIFNGEIYNFLEIRETLLNKGYKFKSKTDTEVVLYSFIEWGPKCLETFRGMFAFCIYQKNNSKFFLARDRFGIKPLIYFYDGINFCFSSEIKALLKIKEIKKSLNEKAIFDYFSYGSIFQPNTIYKELNFLLPGHYMIIEKKKFIQIKKYYDLETVIKKNLHTYKISEIQSLFEEKFSEISNYNLVSDVDISAFLSGGLDSSSVVYSMQQITNKPISTYSVSFEDFGSILDETELAKKTADTFGTNHKTLNINSKNVINSFDKFIDHIDQPSIDGFNTFMISKEVSKFHKVAISGLGGDEIFGGYDFYKNIIKYSANSKSKFDNFLSYINKLRPNRFTNHFQLKNQPPERSILDFRKINNPKNFLKFNINNSQELNIKNSDFTILQRISIFEIKNYLNNTLLRDSDVNSMAHSLEIRPIFLDHKFIEFILSLPDHAKIYNGIQKKILVDFLSKKVPNEVLKSKKKGFEFPFIIWMNGILNQKFMELINCQEIKSIIEYYFDKNYFINLSKRIYAKKLKVYDWSVFIFIYWYYKNHINI